MDRWLTENIVCPRDYSHLRKITDTLICPQGHKYPIIEEIPIMLLEETKPTHEESLKTLEQVRTYPWASQRNDEAVGQDAVDPYVQQVIAATSGIMYKPLIHKLTRYPTPELRLPQGSGEYFLDIGCNWGRWSISAARKGYLPVGIDPSLDAIRAARRVAKQCGVSTIYLVADARYLPFATGCFDAVFSYSVLQHFSKSDVKTCLAEIKRVLKISGFSLIQMPNIMGFRNIFNQAKRGFKRPTSFEVRYWALPELKNTFNTMIGPTSLSVDNYFCLGGQASDINLLPLRYRLVVSCSDKMRKISQKIPWMKCVADSLYVRSVKEKNA